MLKFYLKLRKNHRDKKLLGLLILDILGATHIIVAIGTTGIIHITIHMLIDIIHTMIITILIIIMDITDITIGHIDPIIIPIIIIMDLEGIHILEP
jgi:hypothetical protein